jgi:hypothetical protein
VLLASSWEAVATIGTSSPTGRQSGVDLCGSAVGGVTTARCLSAAEALAAWRLAAAWEGGLVGMVSMVDSAAGRRSAGMRMTLAELGDMTRRSAPGAAAVRGVRVDQHSLVCATIGLNQRDEGWQCEPLGQR